MEPLYIALVFGLVGGLALALAITLTPRKAPSHVVSRRLDAPSPALINMASIRVEGIGGLGMVAAVVLVAVTDPRIRVAIIAAFVLGVALALVLIAVRRGTGALPSGGGSPFDRSMLRLDGPHTAVSSRPLNQRSRDRMPREFSTACPPAKDDRAWLLQLPI